MAYTTTTEIRSITNLTTSDISDEDLTSLISYATSQLNSDVNVQVVRERVYWIDNTRENTLDGSNTTFYVRNWEGKYLSDSDDDGDVDTDDITVYLVASDGTETTATVSSITHNEGKFVLSSAPASSYEMYVTYNWSYADMSTPSKKISLACAFLVAAYAYEKINRGMSPQQVYGNVKFTRDMQAGNSYFQRYESEISKINGEMGDYEESECF